MKKVVITYYFSYPLLLSFMGLLVLNFLTAECSAQVPEKPLKKAITPRISGAKKVSEGSYAMYKLLNAKKVSNYVWDVLNNQEFEEFGTRARPTFHDNGVYFVRVRDQASAQGKLKSLNSGSLLLRKKIIVSNVAPEVSISGPTSGKVDVALSFQADAEDPSIVDMQSGFTYQWDFGDGTTQSVKDATINQITHTFTSGGNFVVSVTASDKDGAISTPAEFIISIAGKPSASPTATPKPKPTLTPTPTPTAKPTPKPTATAVATPTPTAKPTTNPTAKPTAKPTVKPTATPKAPTTPTPTPAPAQIQVRPTEIPDLFSNPDMGWQSNNLINKTGTDSNGYHTSVAYMKYYWKDLEPADGQYDFALFDTYLSRAHARNQKIALRIVVVDEITSAPSWLRDSGAQGFEFKYDENGRIADAMTIWTPNFEDPIFLQKHLEFLQVLGSRYNGHPDVSSIDIGTVGLWGEWHFWGTSPRVPMPSSATTKLIVDKYFEYFNKTPLIAQLEPLDHFQYALSKGAGFRGDCLGFVQNQMDLIYDPNIASTAGAADTWKKAPVIFETCWNISYWMKNNFDLHYIVNWALEHHISALNNKNGLVPATAQSEINRLLKNMGYRFVLRELRHKPKAARGTATTISMDWENIGVAPAYSKYLLNFQLINSSGTVVATIPTTLDIRNWMPGPLTIDQTITVPASITPGSYTLAIGIVDPISSIAAINLAIAGKNASGWYPVSSINVE